MRSTRSAFRLAFVALSLGAAVLFSGVATASADSVWDGGQMASIAVSHG
jgi:hypothetical protein